MTLLYIVGCFVLPASLIWLMASIAVEITVKRTRRHVQARTVLSVVNPLMLPILVSYIISRWEQNWWFWDAFNVVFLPVWAINVARADQDDDDDFWRRNGRKMKRWVGSIGKTRRLVPAAVKK